MIMINSDVRIAVVEDDTGLRTALEQLLRSAGFSAVTFESAEDFLAYEQRSEIACLLADINLPGISGVELVKKVSTNGQRLPAVLMTGRRDAATVQLEREAGAVPRLHKPFSDAALFDTIARVMQH